MNTILDILFGTRMVRMNRVKINHLFVANTSWGKLFNYDLRLDLTYLTTASKMDIPYSEVHKTFLKFCLLVWLSLTLGISTYAQTKIASGQQKKERPNIVFIMSDDHAYQAISAYDTHLIRTPNIDRIAQNGMIFHRATVTNSICAPSRATILTGMHSHLHGKVDNVLPFDTTNLTFPQLFQKEGYETAMFGKLHFGNNPKGVDKFMILPGQGQYINPNFITNEGDTAIQGYVTDIITDLTLDWMENDRNEDKPFLLMYFHKAPHRQWMPAERHFRTFTQKQFPLPTSLFDDYERIKSQHPDNVSTQSIPSLSAEMTIMHEMTLAYDNKVNIETLQKLGIEEKYMNWDSKARMNEQQRKAWEEVYDPISLQFEKMYPVMDDKQLLEWKYQRYMQDYLGCIAAVDENVGRLLDYLEENNLTENTIIVYTSDQGFYLGEHGWFDKRFMYKESFRTPLLVQWPGMVEPGSSSDEMVQNLDYAPTLLEAAGIEIPKQMQGESMVSILKGDTDSWTRDAVYYHYYEYPGVHAVKRHYGVANKRYKLIHFYFDNDSWELYDTEKDPDEMVNVYYDPAYASIRNELTIKLAELRKKYGDNESLDELYLRKSNAVKP